MQSWDLTQIEAPEGTTMPTSRRFIWKISCSCRSSACRKIAFSSSSIRLSKSARIVKKLSTSPSMILYRSSEGRSIDSSRF